MNKEKTYAIKRKIAALFVSGIFIIVFALTNTSSAIAQEIDGKKTEEKADAEKEDKSEEKQSKEEEAGSPTKPAKSPKNFIPSEEISKDLSVSFPVDI